METTGGDGGGVGRTRATSTWTWAEEDEERSASFHETSSSASSPLIQPLVSNISLPRPLPIVPDSQGPATVPTSNSDAARKGLPSRQRTAQSPAALDLTGPTSVHAQGEVGAAAVQLGSSPGPRMAPEDLEQVLDFIGGSFTLRCWS